MFVKIGCAAHISLLRQPWYNSAQTVIQKPFAFMTRIFALGLLLAAAALTGMTALRAQDEPPAAFPAGSSIAGIPVGGLDQSAARLRVEAAYSRPVELAYRDSRIQAAPSDLGFTLDLDAMLAQAGQGARRTWQDRFWADLWNKSGPGPVDVPLQSGFSPEKAQAYLEQEIAPRYDNPPQEPLPRGDTQIIPGHPGWTLDVQSSLPRIQSALGSLSERRVDLVVTGQPIPRVSNEKLEALLKHLVRQDGFDGLVDLAMTNLQTGERINFALWNGEEVDPEIAFTGASTIKIPITLSVLRRTEEPTPQQTLDWLERMMDLSDNGAADALMSTYLSESRGPLVLTEDLRDLGLEDTFLGGYFYDGAPLLQKYDTPANQRTDIDLQPDIYNQTTPNEMDELLAWIDLCAKQDSGPILEKFDGQVSQSECQLILDYMARNRHGMLIEAGLPETVQLAHKHGWVEESDGLLHTMSDASVVYTPGGDFTLSIYLYRTEQLNFDAQNVLVARLAQAVYNAFNVDQQEPWMPYGK